MEATIHSTSLFKDIFPTYESIVTWWKTTPFFIVGFEYKMTNLTACLIFNEYADCHVAFSDDDFKNHFMNDLYTYVNEFQETTKAIDELMKLSDDDISFDDSMITNMADVPETTNSTDATNVDFISQQQKTLTVKSKVRIKREQLSLKRAYTVRAFLSKFKHLFIKILPSPYTFVVGEPEGD